MNVFSGPRLLTLSTLSRLIFPALALFAMPSMADDVKEETRALQPYHSVEVSGSLDVTWMPGETDSAVVKAPAELISRIHTDVQEGRLKVYCTGWFINATQLSITVTGHHLDEVKVTGSGDFTASKLSGDKLTAKVSGSGDLVLNGEVGDFTASLAGSGDLTADHLQAHRADVSVAGSGDATVRASDRLHIALNGSGDVTYFGNPPSVSREIHGSGDVTAK